MKINKSSPTISRKKIIIIVICAVVVLIAGATASYALFFQKPASEPQKTDPAVKNEDSGVIQGSVDPNKGDSKTIIPTNPNSGSTSGDIEKPVITRASQSSTNIKVVAIFSQPAYGNCTVTFEKPGQVNITRTAAIVVGASYYACDGFTVPASAFPSKGTWTVTVTHDDSGKSSTSDKQDVEVQ